MEFLSSTSEDVCEVWDKKGVVRKVGTENVYQLLFDNTPGSQDVVGMWDAEQKAYLIRRDKGGHEFTLPEDVKEEESIAS